MLKMKTEQLWKHFLLWKAANAAQNPVLVHGTELQCKYSAFILSFIFSCICMLIFRLITNSYSSVSH